jgi:hypothetical protein
MATHAADVQNVRFEGEIVELLEEAGRRLAKIKLTAPLVVDLPGAAIADAHLGDRVVISGWIADIGSPTRDST